MGLAPVGRSARRCILALLALIAAGHADADGRKDAAEIAKAIAALAPGQWYEIPDSQLLAVAARPSPGGGVGGVIGAWGGGAYDTKRDRLIVWGGGHGDYAGNEIYVFSMKTFAWTRLTEPSAFPPDDPKNKAHARRHPDGRPVSRHTYDYLEYIPPPVDRFYVGGGAILWKDGQFGDDTTWLFDFERNEWEARSDCPARGTGATSAVGPDGRVWQHGPKGDQAVLASYDATRDEWKVHARFGGWFGYNRTAAIDPLERKYVAVGEGAIWVWDLDRPGERVVAVDTRGDDAIERTKYPGVDFDPVTERLVAWNGGATVYSLDLDTNTWAARPTEGVGTTPPEAAYNGTHGRWRYVPSRNVFVVVSDVSANVYVYRHAVP